MPDEPSINTRMFQGQFSNQDEMDLQPGQMSLQINLAIIRQGEVQIRAGARRMTYDTE